MRKVLAGAMVSTMALCIIAAVVALGGVNQDLVLIAYAFGGVALLGWVGKLFLGEAVSWKHSPVHWPVLGFFIYAIARYLTSPIEYDSRLELLNVGFYTLIYFLCAANFYHSRDRTIFLAALMVLAVGESVYGIWQFWARPDSVLIFSRPDEYVGRASGTYICPNHYAGLMEMLLALLVARLALWNPSKTAVQKVALQKVFVGYVALMVACALMLSLSRSAWVATVVGMITFLFWGEVEWRRLWPRLVGGVAAIIVLVLIAVNVGPVRLYIAQTFSEPTPGKTLTLDDKTLGDRTILWRDTAKIVGDYAAFGTGPGTWQWFHPEYQPKEMQAYAALAHNDILNLASDYGLVGFTLILLVLITFYRHVAAFVDRANSSDRRSFAVGSAVAITIIAIHSWFDFNMHIPANALLVTTLVGFTVAMEDSANRFRRIELTRPWRIALGIVLMALLGFGGWTAGRTAWAYYYQTQGKRYKAYMYWDDALDLYQQAIAIDPKAPVPHARLGDIYRAQSFWRVDPDRAGERKELARKAIQAYRRSLDLNPRQVEVWVNLAKVLGLAGDQAEAEQAFLKAIALSPTTAYVHQELALFYREHGDDARALKAFEQAQSLAWNEVSAMNIEELKSQQRH